MVRFFLFATICLVLCCCYRNIDGYRVNAFHNYENLWEHPVDLDSDEEQIIDVPFVKYGYKFSLCFDRERGNPVTLPDSEAYLEHDSLEVSFHIADTVFLGESISSSLPEYNCPINGRYLLFFFLPENFNREQGGQLRIRVRKRHYLKNIPNARVVLGWGHGSWK
jgi:hypothetical protein